MGSQWWFLIIFFGFSFVSWLIGKLREQAEINRVRQERQRQREEALRTGRASGQSSVSTAQFDAGSQAQTMRGGADDLASRRQAQLRALRAEQLERMRRQAQSAPQQRSRPIREIRPEIGSQRREGRPPLRESRPQQQRQTPSGPQRPSSRPVRPAPQSAAARSAAQREAFARKRQEELRRRAAQPERAREFESRPFKSLADRLAATPVRKQSAMEQIRPGEPISRMFKRRLTRDDLRRAFVFTQIFGPPASNRRGLPWEQQI